MDSPGRGDPPDYYSVSGGARRWQHHLRGKDGAPRRNQACKLALEICLLAGNSPASRTGFQETALLAKTDCGARLVSAVEAKAAEK